MVFREGDTQAKKPAAVMIHNTNMLYSLYTPSMNDQLIMETFFVNTLWRHHQVRKKRRPGCYQINGKTDICVCDRTKRLRTSPDTIYARYNTEVGRGNEIPLWLFGFLY